MCYFTPTEWGCGHVTYLKVSCRHIATYKAQGKTCPFNTTLGTLKRNRSCGNGTNCSDAQIESLEGSQSVSTTCLPRVPEEQASLSPTRP